MAAVRHEVGLLTRSAQVEDNCWEQRVRAGESVVNVGYVKCMFDYNERSLTMS